MRAAALLVCCLCAHLAYANAVSTASTVSTGGVKPTKLRRSKGESKAKLRRRLGLGLADAAAKHGDAHAGGGLVGVIGAAEVVIVGASSSALSKGGASTSASTSAPKSAGADIVGQWGSAEDPTYRKLRYQVLSLLVPWLYFMCVSINIPTLPKYVNIIINKDAGVSDESAQVYGNISGLDSFFTFLSVNFVGCLSDRFGRKPFMFYSSLGIGAAFTMLSRAKSPRDFYIAASLDGLTSCMLSQSQAYITDHQEGNLSIALSRFQGLAIGMAFMFGIPLGAVLSDKLGPTAPFRVALAICMLNCLLIAFALPDAPSLAGNAGPSTADVADVLTAAGVVAEVDRGLLRGPRTAVERVQDVVGGVAGGVQGAASAVGGAVVGVAEAAVTALGGKSNKRINWSAANPFGAAVMLTRTQKLLVGSVAYFLLNLAHSGLQVTWINFLQYKFGLSAAMSGSTLMVVGFVVALLPPIVIPLIGVVNSFKYGTLLYSLSLVYLASAGSTFAIFCGMPFLAAGASAMPIMLGYLTEQVPRSEVGAMQGAADTVRTVASMIGSPLVSRAFGYFISDKYTLGDKSRALPGGALYAAAGASLLGYLMVANF